MPHSPKAKLDEQTASANSPTQKRLRLSPPMRPSVDAPKPPLPPLKSITSSPSQTAKKLAELRHTYLEDITMVVQELKNVLAFGPGTACPESPVSPATALKLVRTVQTLEKLRALLLMNPARLRKVSLAQLNTVEQQVKKNLLPLATLFRSFDGEQIARQDAGKAKNEHDECSTKSPRSPSGLSVGAPELPHDWRFLSMALSLQL